MTRKSHQYPSSIYNIKANYEIVKGLEIDIERKLSISYGPATVSEIMDKIKLVEECCVEAGIDIARNNWDKQAKNNLWKAREQR